MTDKRRAVLDQAMYFLRQADKALMEIKKPDADVQDAKRELRRAFAALVLAANATSAH